MPALRGAWVGCRLCLSFAACAFSGPLAGHYFRGRQQPAPAPLAPHKKSPAWNSGAYSLLTARNSTVRRFYNTELYNGGNRRNLPTCGDNAPEWLSFRRRPQAPSSDRRFGFCARLGTQVRFELLRDSNSPRVQALGRSSRHRRAVSASIRFYCRPVPHVPAP
jgi:hypothetical protein